MVQPKKLIEVAMPIKEISAESVTDVRIQHGHISSLHTWWARRPLPACQAVIFASLVPDPLDENCPESFRDAIQILIGRDGKQWDCYKPYDDIPFTAAVDKMEDNMRNRLLMFIGRFSELFLLNERIGKKTDAKDQISEDSLIKWDNKNNEAILTIGRKLIWVAHNAQSGNSAKSMLEEFDKKFNSIKEAEHDLYELENRHIESEKNKRLTECLNNSIDAFLNKMPIVFDPFAGGGAIPLEAARLGCRSFGNDINPVAHIIQMGSVEFPQKFGKPARFSIKEFIKLYGKEEWEKVTDNMLIFEKGEPIAVKVENRLSFDVEYYANKLLKETEKEIGYLYPSDSKGRKPIAYYWARIGVCSNPSCKAEVPMLRTFHLCTKGEKLVYLKPKIDGKNIDFDICHGNFEIKGWNNRGNLTCPCCGNITDVKKIKEQSIKGNLKSKILAVIEDFGDGKIYRKPNEQEIVAGSKITTRINEPTENMQRNSAGGDTFGWGISKWGQLFSNRQLFLLNTLVTKLNDLKAELHCDNDPYYKAILTYLAILIDRGATRLTCFGVWNPQYEKIQPIFSRQALPMVFDYPESVFTHFEGPIASQLGWILKVIEKESFNPFVSTCFNSSSGEKSQFPEKYLTAVITDPPYYDAIAYADLSDFFYVWLKRSLNDIYPLNFSTPQTPKAEECTALKHHHDNDSEKAKQHFENKLLDIFRAIEYQTKEIVSIMFAHQSTGAWTTLCNSILGAKMNITGSWALDTEMTGALKTDKSFLSSSVTVSCRPSHRKGVGDYKDVRKAVEKTVANEVNELYSLGFRGADLLTACFGQAVSVFGEFERVEKADGSEVIVAELLEMAKESAFNALLKGFDGDDFTKFYIGWLQLYGFTESDFDDAVKFSRVGLTINVSELFDHAIFTKRGNKQELAGYKERIHSNHKLGEDGRGFIIDQVHRAMFLFSGTNRMELLQCISKTASSPENSFWRVLNSLCEVLPQGSDDIKQASGLLLNKDSLIRESKNIRKPTSSEPELF